MSPGVSEYRRTCRRRAQSPWAKALSCPVRHRDDPSEEEKHITEARKDEREQRQLLTLSNELSQPRRQEQEDPQ
ncbi:hypothetical protein H920_19124 [Fukomys damarensis]|uniref:Uncharacterized protein n=1 Tax=Fukomys damarensis TaxID=885580 RepID=A0A091CLA5_FUKDA|nr:hypothetical protein H920_19124 [Fukomys damarensis]